MIYETPPEVAKWMATFVSPRAQSILEPAAGNGALLKAIVPRLRSPVGRIVAVDLDNRALNLCRDIAGPPGWLAETHNADFLSLPLTGGFDCAIMNPPFASRREKWVTISYGGAEHVCGVEAAFILRILELLRNGGRMIGLFPAGIIKGNSCEWLRDTLAQNGTIKIVHELPERTFRTADVKTFIVVFDKRKSRGPLRLLNHSLTDPEQLLISSRRGRLDFAFHEAKRELRRLKHGTSIAWIPLQDLAEVLRGDISTPTTRRAIHTTHYADGFWIPQHLHKDRVSKRVAKPTDILARRVSRNCAITFGLLRNRRSSSATDCVIIIRPAKDVDRESLLFSLRVFFGWKWARAFVERGAGASFISQEALSAASIPANLHDIAAPKFLRYRAALKKKNFAEMQSIEAETRGQFC
jgi:hypothetical protein